MTVLAALGVTRRFAARGGRGFGRTHRPGVLAVDDVTLELAAGETLALVGESGSGKSTLGRMLAGLDTPDAGVVLFRGQRLDGMSRAQMVSFHRGVQVVFQDPHASLNPRMTVGSMLEEVFAVHRIATGAAASVRVAALLERVGLDPGAARRYPHEFSGGQRQRVGIARALAVEPTIVVADEPVSALDVSVQAKILGLLADLQHELGLGYLFISHDLAVVRAVADRVAVMRAGRIVETGPADQLYDQPRNEYTRALLSAVPTLPRLT